jgi:hypothetical protein
MHVQSLVFTWRKAGQTHFLPAHPQRTLRKLYIFLTQARLTG